MSHNNSLFNPMLIKMYFSIKFFKYMEAFFNQIFNQMCKAHS